MIEKFRKYIADNKLCKPTDKVLVGVSAGADSMVLINLLQKAGFRCSIAHMNFSLRGIESDQDALFVEAYAKDKGIPFYAKKVDTLAYAKKQGISMEMAARGLRYHFFNQLLEEHQLDVLAVGHHQNDLAETMLINLIRGTGLRGLSGIKAKNGEVIRPLLCFNNAEILEYAYANKIRFRTDSSNTDTNIIRNKIRHHIIPELESINASVLNTLVDTSKRMQQVQQLVDEQVVEFKRKYVSEIGNKTRIQLAGIRKNSNKELILFELLHPLGYNGSQLEEIVVALDGIPGKHWFANKNRVSITAEALLLQKEYQEVKHVEISIDESCMSLDRPIKMAFKRLQNPGIKSLKFSNVQVYFDASKIEYPLTLRNCRVGDRFQPYGMKGSKKLSDFFIDQKFTPDQKEEALVLCSGNEIIYLVGYRTSERFKVDSGTKEILELKIL